MKKFYLVNVLSAFSKKTRDEFQEGRTIVFEMPSFCSGEYTALIHKDEFGLFIDADENFFAGCRDWSFK